MGRREGKPGKCEDCGKPIHLHGMQTRCKPCLNAKTLERQRQYRKTKRQIPCEHCGEIIARPHGGTNYCSQDCLEIATCPTPEEIVERAAEIRKSWEPIDWLIRGHKTVDVEIQVVSESIFFGS